MEKKSNKDITNKELLDFLCNEIITIIYYFYTYKNIYYNNPKKTSFLNVTAPLFFSIIQFSILDSIILKINRILDAYKIGKNKNLSINIFIEEKEFSSFKKEIEEINELSKNIKEIRKKIIAHNDYNINLKKIKNPNLETFSYKIKEMEKIIIKIAKLVKKIYESNYNTHLDIDYEYIKKDINTEGINLMEKLGFIK